MKVADIKPLFIIDTSVLLKWFIKEEEDLEQAQLLKKNFLERKFETCIPALTSWELNNNFGRNHSKQEALMSFASFKNLRIREALLGLEVSFLAYKIMKKCPGVAFYDSAYHALALQLNGIFITADQKYYNKAKSFGRMKLLRDYK